MSSKNRWLLAAGLLAVLAPFTATAQFVTGLEGASGSTVGPDGALYVTEGAAGRVSRVDTTTGELTTLVSGLPPSIPQIGVGGAMDVAFLDGTAYVLTTLVGPDVGGGGVAGIYRVDGPASSSPIADIGAYSIANPPSTAFFVPSGVQYALETFRGGFLVTDGHHNRVLRVTLDGEVTAFKTFGNIVPTGLEVHGNTVYMAEAGPIPHLPEDGKVITIDANSREVTEIGSGGRLLVDVEFGLGRTLYALSQGFWDGPMDGAPADPFTGSLVKVNANGSFTVLATALNIPTSFEFIGNTAYVVSLTGDVWRIPDISGPPFGVSN
jgi:hypothetical protein